MTIIAVICDVVGVLAFILALVQWLERFARFRAFDISIDIIGDLHIGHYAVMSLSVANDSSQALCVETLRIRVGNSGVVSPLSPIQTTKLYRTLPSASQTDRDLIASASSVPAHIAAHSAARISLVYRIDSKQLLEPLLDLSEPASSTPCTENSNGAYLQAHASALDLFFSVRGRSVLRSVEASNIRFSGISDTSN